MNDRQRPDALLRTRHPLPRRELAGRRQRRRHRPHRLLLRAHLRWRARVRVRSDVAGPLRLEEEVRAEDGQGGGDSVAQILHGGSR